MTPIKLPRFCYGRNHTGARKEEEDFGQPIVLDATSDYPVFACAQISELSALDGDVDCNLDLQPCWIFAALQKELPTARV